MTSDLATAISNASASTGVPVSLLSAQCEEESGCDQSAVGAAGEIGAFQLLPSTAASLGVDPTDVNQNALGAATYLSQLYNQYGSYDLALAAYNAGSGTVDDALATYGSDWMAGIPASTQNYVTNVLGSSGLAETSSAAGGVSTPGTVATVESDVGSFVSGLSTWEIAAVAGLAALLIWYLM